MAKRTWAERIEHMDRRIVFLLMGGAIIFPLFVPFGLTVESSRPVEDFAAVVEGIPPGSVVLVADDWDPGSIAELKTASVVVLEHLFKQNLRVVDLTLWEGGPGIVARTMQEVGDRNGKVYGEDYVFLGFKSGREQVMVPIAENIRAIFPSDFRGTSVDDIPVMDGIEKIEDFALMISVSAGYPGTKEWVQQVSSRFPEVPMLCATGAVSAPEYYAYYESGQLKGLVGGLPAMAAYEKRIDREAFASKGMDAQSAGNYMLVALIVLGNALFLVNRYQSGRNGARGDRE